MTFNDVFKKYNEALEVLSNDLENDLNNTVKIVVIKELEAQKNSGDFKDRIHESFSVTIDEYLKQLVKSDIFEKHIKNLKDKLYDEIQEFEAVIESEFTESIGNKLELRKVSNKSITSADNRVADIFASKLKDIL
jgi:hypothetical protein